METPSWETGLDAKGLYYEGIVDDATALLDKHKINTVTTYGIRRSRKNHQLPHSTSDTFNEAVNKENSSPNTQVLHTSTISNHHLISFIQYELTCISDNNDKFIMYIIITSRRLQPVPI